MSLFGLNHWQQSILLKICEIAFDNWINDAVLIDSFRARVSGLEFQNLRLGLEVWVRGSDLRLKEMISADVMAGVAQ